MNIDDERNLNSTLAKKADLIDGKVPDSQLPSMPGGGDMLKSIYDPSSTGKIAEAQLTLNYSTHSNALDHSHSNKTLLDTYTQTEANLADSVSKKHDASHTIASYDTTATGAQLNELVGGGQTALHNHAGGGDGEVSVVATADTANATTTLANATGLTFNALANSTYIIEVFLVWASSATTVGIKVSATASGTPTITVGHFIADAANGTPDSSSYNANDVVVTTSASPFTTNNMGQLAAILKTSASASTWQLRFAAETTGTITIKTGSTIRYRKVA